MTKSRKHELISELLRLGYRATYGALAKYDVASLRETLDRFASYHPMTQKPAKTPRHVYAHPFSCEELGQR